MIDQYDALIFAAAESTDNAIDETNKLAYLIDDDDQFCNIEYVKNIHLSFGNL